MDYLLYRLTVFTGSGVPALATGKVQIPGRSLVSLPTRSQEAGAPTESKGSQAQSKIGTQELPRPADLVDRNAFVSVLNRNAALLSANEQLIRERNSYVESVADSIMESLVVQRNVERQELKTETLQVELVSMQARLAISEQERRQCYTVLGDCLAFEATKGALWVPRPTIAQLGEMRYLIPGYINGLPDDEPSPPPQRGRRPSSSSSSSRQSRRGRGGFR